MTVIGIHGGAFCLGHSGMVSADQIQDCQDRGWIVVVPEHRLCPQVDILKGPVTDCRDLLDWIHAGELDKKLAETASSFRVDYERMVTFGTSSGGTLALALVSIQSLPFLAAFPSKSVLGWILHD